MLNYNRLFSGSKTNKKVRKKRTQWVHIIQNNDTLVYVNRKKYVTVFVTIRLGHFKHTRNSMKKDLYCKIKIDKVKRSNSNTKGFVYTRITTINVSNKFSRTDN